MSANVRLNLFLGAGLVLAAIFAFAIRAFPPSGNQWKPYGDLVDAISVPERHVTDVVNAVTYDIRGFDTLGEEFIFFSAVAGVLLLLRRPPDEPLNRTKDHVPWRAVPRPSMAVRILAVALAGPTVVFGFYVVTHGQLTPGGGFQGGVVLSAAPLLAYLAGTFSELAALAPQKLVDAGEAVGAGGYVLIGVASLAAGGAYLQNVIPIGQLGSITSGGTVALIDLAVGLEVGCGLLLLLATLLEKTLTVRTS
jgi:multicomponent Na+:H+ antiporter subunit B